MNRHWKIITVVSIIFFAVIGSFWIFQEDRMSLPTIGQVTIEISKNGFQPANLDYQEGDEISLYVVNKDNHVHNFIIPDYRIFSANLNPGETTTISFQAVKKGQFGYFSDAPGFLEPGYHGEMQVK